MGVSLHVTYTDAYPDEPPEWELEDAGGEQEEGRSHLGLPD